MRPSLDYAQMADDSLTIAYRAARYEVHLPDQRVSLQVDAPSEPLRRWLRAQGHRCAALLTAHNPASQLHDAAVNAQAQRQLQAAIHARGLAFHAGCNLDPQGIWPAEDSLLVPDLSLEDARALALRFGQRAFLWCDDSGTPRLHETRPA
jgi:hypothetical protein